MSFQGLSFKLIKLLTTMVQVIAIYWPRTYRRILRPRRSRLLLRLWGFERWNRWIVHYKWLSLEFAARLVDIRRWRDIIVLYRRISCLAELRKTSKGRISFCETYTILLIASSEKKLIIEALKSGGKLVGLIGAVLKKVERRIEYNSSTEVFSLLLLFMFKCWRGKNIKLNCN